ncbi:MAG: hypothetical protein GW949_02610 [Spirochaetales bacterium]|nr:hypothetical protein [Spirochaetales bacterium]
MTEFTLGIIGEISAIPPKKVLTYGKVARRAGNPRGTRQGVRGLHT